MNKTPNRAPKNAILCRISSTIQWCCQIQTPGAINKKKIRKKQTFENCKWFQVALATRIPKFLNQGDPQQSCRERHSMQNFELYSAVQSQRNPGSLNKKPTTKKKKFRELQVIRDRPRARIPKFLRDGDTPQSFRERHSMQNFVLYSVVLSEPSPGSPNEKKTTKKTKFLRTASDSRSPSPREFPNFPMNKTPNRAPKNAIRCRISSSIHWCCQNQTPGPINKKKIRKKQNF